MRKPALLVVVLPAILCAQGGFSGPGRYEITNLKSGRAFGLDRDQSGVVQTTAGDDYALWDIESAGRGLFYIRSAVNGGMLEARDHRNSAPLYVSRSRGGQDTMWRIEPGKDGNALIVSSHGRAIDIPDGSDRLGLRIQIYDLNGDSNQRFMFRMARRGGYGNGRRDMDRPNFDRGVGERFNCSSDDGRRNYCRGDMRGDVRMVRQISGSPCREGDTWGRDRDGVWVDRGCRAEFEVVSRGAGRFDRGDSRSQTTQITCSSDDGRRNFCRADTRGGVRMIRQRSGSPCRQGETWGWDRDNIWVDRGCRADFEIGGGR